VTWFRKGADLGNATAQFNLGRMYENGRGARRDYVEANKWYAKSAEQGIPEAQFNRGIMYYVGRGVRKDFTEAHRWFRLAALTFPESEADKRQGAATNRDLVASQMTPEQIAEADAKVKPPARH
jgi:TPR repeat protein